MCSDPQTRKFRATEVTFACRKCNDCVSARRAEYIGRGMMERATAQHCYVFALTYSDEKEEYRNAAQFFNYSHVRAFIHRLNSALHRLNASSGVRFMAAGEQGDITNRCHWHVVLFSPVDLLTVGTFQRVLNGKKVFVTEKKLLLSRIGGDERGKVRLSWSLWPHGFAVVQQGDQGGLSYALSYALKDQFTVEKSADTMRHAKAENFATGLFRMSKRPPIGHEWLEQKFQRLAENYSILPSLDITVPEMRGYYHPSGSTREMILSRLAAITWATRDKLGRNPAQFSSLMACLSKPDEKAQFYDKKTYEKTKQPASSGFFDQQRAIDAEQGRIARRCGSSIPCLECLRAKPDTAARLGLTPYSRQIGDNIEITYFDTQGKSFEKISRFTGVTNSACALKGSRFLGSCLSPCPEAG